MCDIQSIPEVDILSTFVYYHSKMFRKSCIGVLFCLMIMIFFTVKHDADRTRELNMYRRHQQPMADTALLRMHNDKKKHILELKHDQSQNNTFHCGDKETATSFNHSKFYIRKVNNGYIEVLITAMTWNNVSKNEGGDIFLLRAKKHISNELCSGRVVDNSDGTYTGIISIPWSGKTEIHVKLGSVSENACLFRNARLRYGNSHLAVNSWGINAVFRGPNYRESTVCGILPPLPEYSGSAHDQIGVVRSHKRCKRQRYNATDCDMKYTHVCNYTARNDGNPWYCGKPSNFTCDDIYAFDMHDYKVKRIPDNEVVSIKGNGALPNIIYVNVESKTIQKPTVSCRSIERYKTWTRNSSSGFWNKTLWTSLICKDSTTHSIQHYRKCLNGKYIAFFGDSSIRQIVEYLTKNVLQIGKIDIRHQYGRNRSFHPDTVFRGHNISITYRKHAMPYINDDVRPNNIKDVPRLLTEIADGELAEESVIVVINYYLHFVHFPPSEYRIRLAKLVKSIKYLLKRKPKISGNVFLKGAYFSDSVGWFEGKSLLLFRDIMFEEFHDIMNDVVYLDIWDITVAHNSQVVHPEKHAFDSQIQQLMGYICE